LKIEPETHTPTHPQKQNKRAARFYNFPQTKKKNKKRECGMRVTLCLDIKNGEGSGGEEALIKGRKMEKRGGDISSFYLNLK